MITSFAELEMVARTVYGEARGEPFNGQSAVAHVIFNRVLAGRFGSGVIGVCQRRLQFSCWNQDDPNYHELTRVDLKELGLRRATEAVLAALAQRPAFTLQDSTHYFAESLPAFPRWAVGKTPTLIIGRHLFFNDIV